MYDKKFVEQVKLLLICLPSVAQEKRFALKGGTAINLFFYNLPRLSVDIDLTYLPIENREDTITNIQQGLLNIIKEIKRLFPNFIFKPIYDKDGKVILKYMVHHKNTAIKIEPNFVLRGNLYPIVEGSLCEEINNRYSVKLLDIPILDKSEVYAGKLCAALSRQHPRDLFDMKILLNDEGITDKIRSAFVVYLASNTKPIHEILSPNLNDIKSAYQNEFVRMTDAEVSLDDLLDVRQYLINNVKESLTMNEREFLYSIKLGQPKYNLMPFENLNEWPGIKWKLLNIHKMSQGKAKVMQNKLKSILGL